MDRGVLPRLRLVLLTTSIALASCAAPAHVDWRADVAAWKPSSPLPSFPLVDDHDVHRSLYEFAAPLLVSFVYTRCPVATPCPLTMQRLAAEHAAHGINVLVVTPDPAHDTPAVLHAYR